MTGYIGTNKADFRILSSQVSRYGFPAVFFATEMFLAELYAADKCKKSASDKPGYVFSAALPDRMHRVNFGGRFTYTPDFRNMIYKLHTRYPIVQMYNVVDSPSKEFFRVNTSDVIVVFDLSLISNLRMVRNDILHYMY